MKMNHFATSVAVILSLGLLLSSCSSAPEHARYIPNNAAVVIGINTKELSKKIAWNAITGSKILDKIREQQPKDAAKQLDQAGFKVMSTIYFYAQSSPSQGSNDQLIALIPLDDAVKWESYVKRVFPAVNIKTVGDRKEALLTDGLYAGWNKSLLIVEGLHDGKEDMMGKLRNTVSQDSIGGTAITAPAIIHDEQTLSAEMARAFAVTKENSLINDKRFTGNEKSGHDITIWVNYDPIMGKYMGAGAMGGLNLSSLWKGAAAAGGFDFEKGKIDGNMQYYVSKDLKEAGQELGKSNASTELLNRFPADNLDMITAWHISPKGLKMVLDKSGLMGFLNLGLMSQNISYDDITDGFTGDMAYSISDFKMENSPTTDSAATMKYSPKANYIYALKINKKEAFNRLLKWAIKSEFLKSTGNNFYTISNVPDNKMVIAVNDQYFVSANTTEIAQSFLDGKFKSEKMPEAVKKEVYGHPFGMFVDVKALVGNLQIPTGTDYADSVIMVEAKKLFTHVTMNGGEFRGDAFSNHMTLNFTNKKENSLLELIDFSMTAQAAKEKQSKNMAAITAGANANNSNIAVDTVQTNH